MTGVNRQVVAHYSYGSLPSDSVICYRWEFKKDVNVRLDYGFGKSGQSGFIFNIGEAF